MHTEKEAWLSKNGLDWVLRSAHSNHRLQALASAHSQKLRNALSASAEFPPGPPLSTASFRPASLEQKGLAGRARAPAPGAHSTVAWSPSHACHLCHALRHALCLPHCAIIATPLTMPWVIIPVPTGSLSPEHLVAAVLLQLRAAPSAFGRLTWLRLESKPDCPPFAKRHA